MSVTTETRAELESRFNDVALEQAVEEHLPSRPITDAPSGSEAEATAPPGRTPAAAGTETAPTDSTAAPEPPASSPKTTFPKTWKGTEDEWQAFRAEQNRTADRARQEATAERERAATAERERAALADRLAYFEAQLTTRDAAYQDILTQAYQDPRTVSEKLAASQYAGNQQYVTLAQQRAAEAARLAAEAAQRETFQSVAIQQAELDQQTTFQSHLLPLMTEAVRAGAGDLDVEALLKDALASDDLKDDVAETYGVPEATRLRMVARIYREATKAVRTQIEAARDAKAAATPTSDDRKAGRQTLLGGTSGHGAVTDFSEETVTKGLDDHYRARGWEKTHAAS